MPLRDVKSRAAMLRSLIEYHNYRYHTLDDPEIDDTEYDALVKELQGLEAQYPELVTPDSPTQRVGAARLSSFQSVRHPAQLLSLDNAFSAGEVRAWFERVARRFPANATIEIVAEPKIDGLSVALHYEQGIFSLGATRGDGVAGEDVTPNLRTVRSIPLTIPVIAPEENGKAKKPTRKAKAKPSEHRYVTLADSGALEESPRWTKPPEYVVVRGEVYFPKTKFEEMNRQIVAAGGKPYANPRNTAAGTVRQLDARITATRPLRFYGYNIIASRGLRLSSQWEALHFLKAMGFPVNPASRLCRDIDDAIAYGEQWLKQRQSLSYEADGIVFKVNDFSKQLELGFIGKAPRWAIAFKQASEGAVTQLLAIEVQVGRVGTITPLAVLTPVQVGGVTIVNATLHNEDYIRDNDIRIGDRVRVKRAGEVIPQVVGPLLELRTGDEKPYKFPTRCPSCGEKLERRDGESATYCINPLCPAQLIRQIEHFAGRGAMDIEGLGEKLAVLFVEKGFLKDIADIYTLGKRRDELLEMEGFGEKKIDNLYAAIEASKSRSLARLIFALGIRHVGGTVSELLADHYESLEGLSKAKEDELDEIRGLGPEIVSSIVAYFEHEKAKELVKKLRKLGVNPIREARAAGSGKLTGKTFVITGTLPTFSREQAAEFIKQHGGKVTDSISKKTDYLLVGENAGSKLDKAKLLGVATVNEEELRALVG